MKKRLVIILSLITAVCALFACVKKDKPDAEVKPDLTINKTSAQMIFGDTLELIANYNAINGQTLSWSSENESVAVVDDGTVTAVGVGSTRIKVSYGGENKYCGVLVTYGDISPVLKIKSVSDGLSLYKGDRFEIEGEVSFNSKDYPCEIKATIVDENVLGFDNATNELIAKGKGSSRVTFSTEWKGFDGALLSVDADVNVFAPLYAETIVAYNDGRSEFTDKLELWTSDSWCGSSYATEATLGIEAFNGNEKLSASAVSCALVSDELISYDETTGLIKVNAGGKTGETVLKITIEADGEKMTSNVTVSVRCPLADYSEFVEYSAASGLVGKTWEELFGADYEIIAAYQGEKSLSFEKKGSNGILKDIKAVGTETEPFVVQSAKGAYRFVNVDAYTDVLSESNIVDMLAPAKVPAGYYIMKNDVTADFTGRRNGNSADCFVGTFDGRGYTLNATVGGYGVFGSLGNGAVVKNTHFSFTFGGSGATLTQWDISVPDAYCGLAANNDNMLEGYATTKGEYHVTFNNLRITTTNYKPNSFAIMGVKPFFLHMKDVLVELNGLDDGYSFTDASADSSALFAVDRTGCMTGYADSALNGIKSGNLVTNVYFVTKTFMPLASFVTTSSKRNFVWYAGNDVKKLGRAAEQSPLRLTSASAAGSAKAKLFGSIWGTKSCTTYNPYILRYDTAADLKESGVTKVGSWIID